MLLSGIGTNIYCQFELSLRDIGKFAVLNAEVRKFPCQSVALMHCGETRSFDKRICLEGAETRGFPEPASRRLPGEDEKQTAATRQDKCIQSCGDLVREMRWLAIEELLATTWCKLGKAK
jgi:hypothetical protein